MDSTPMRRGGRSGEGSPRRDAATSSGDVLEDVLDRFRALEASPSGRALVAQILAAALMAFTRTRAVRDPLPDTAPGSAEESLAVLAGLDQLEASLAAVGATWQVAAEERIRRDDHERGIPSAAQGRGSGQEIALARRVSPAASSFSLAKSRRLVQSMPEAMDLLWSGGMTSQQASAVSGALDGASAETCHRIDEFLGANPEVLEGKGHRRLQSDVRRLVQELEPETSRERAERAARARHVRMVPLADGMARVTAVLRAVDAAGMMRNLNARAEAKRASGARTSLSAIEADLLVEDVLRAAEPATPRARTGLEIGIVITDTALLGREDDAETAELEGYGTIPAHIVRDTLLGRAPGSVRADEDEHPDPEVADFYRRLYRSPRTGDLVAMESKSRAFPAGLARMIRLRDTTCRTPWCTAKIRHIDHAVPHHGGGPTSYANGQGLCARCNLLKEHGLWVLSPLSGSAVRDDAPGPVAEPLSGPSASSGPPEPPDPASPPASWIWTSPHGARGVSHTPPLTSPTPEPQPDVAGRDGLGPEEPDQPGDPEEPGRRHLGGPGANRPDPPGAPPGH